MREMMAFDTLRLHKCDTNMVDSNRHQAVSHVSENEEHEKGETQKPFDVQSDIYQLHMTSSSAQN